MITKKQFQDILQSYEASLSKYLETDTDSAKHPRQMADTYYEANTHSIPTSVSGRHVLWMCRKILDLIEDGKMEKANRWLGFVQGYLWCNGLRTIKEMRGDNR